MCGPCDKLFVEQNVEIGAGRPQRTGRVDKIADWTVAIKGTDGEDVEQINFH